MSNPKKKGTGVKLWSVMTVLLVILLIASIVGTNIALSSAQAINIALKTPTHKVINQDGSVVYYESDFDSVEALEAHDKEIAEQLHAEGSVLLLNNGALPLSGGEKISAFGHNSVSIATCGTGSADIDTSNAPPEGSTGSRGLRS